MWSELATMCEMRFRRPLLEIEATCREATARYAFARAVLISEFRYGWAATQELNLIIKPNGMNKIDYRGTTAITSRRQNGR
jgi:hypothetical protein